MAFRKVTGSAIDIKAFQDEPFEGEYLGNKKIKTKPVFMAALCSVVIILCIVGGYAPSQKMHDVWLIAGFGVAGYLLRKADYPLAPLVLALVLGPLMEKSFRQTLIGEQGNILAFIERPLSATFIALALVFFLLPLVKYIKTLRKRGITPAE